MTPEILKEKIGELSPDIKIEITDLTGTEDHYRILIVSKVFHDRSTIERHRMVHHLLAEDFDSRALHAVALKTLTPKEFEGISK